MDFVSYLFKMIQLKFWTKGPVKERKKRGEERARTCARKKEREWTNGPMFKAWRVNPCILLRHRRRGSRIGSSQECERRPCRATSDCEFESNHFHVRIERSNLENAAVGKWSGQARPPTFGNVFIDRIEKMNALVQCRPMGETLLWQTNGRTEMEIIREFSTFRRG